MLGQCFKFLALDPEGPSASANPAWHCHIPVGATACVLIYLLHPLTPTIADWWYHVWFTSRQEIIAGSSGICPGSTAFTQQLSRSAPLSTSLLSAILLPLLWCDLHSSPIFEVRKKKTIVVPCRSATGVRAPSFSDHRAPWVNQSRSSAYCASTILQRSRDPGLYTEEQWLLLIPTHLFPFEARCRSIRGNHGRSPWLSL